MASVDVFDLHQDHPEVELVDRLHTAIGEVNTFLSESAAFLPADRVERLLLEVVRADTRMEGIKAAVTAEADAAGVAQNHGVRTLTTFLALETHGCAKVIGPDRTFAVWLGDFPIFAAALSAGDITRQHVNELKGVDNSRVHQLLIRDQQLLVDFALRLQWPDWGKTVAYWLNAADPDGTDTDPANPKYGLRTRTWANGDVTITARMDPITGEAFLTANDHETQKLWRQQQTSEAGVTSTVPQLQLAASMRLVTRGFKRKNGKYPVPLVNIVMSEQVAEDLLARVTGCENPDSHGPLDIDPFQLPIDWDHIDSRSETIRGTPIHPKHALWLLLIGNLRRTVMSTQSRVLDLGRDARLFNNNQRTALLVECRGQCADGCQNPFRWLQADHIIPWCLHGLTNLINGTMRCNPDNLAKGGHPPKPRR